MMARLNLHDTFWIVTNPGPFSTLPDVCFECTLAGMFNQIRGGLRESENPTLYTRLEDAQLDAENRINERNHARTAAQ
jgi:hypothetical protein